MSFCWSVKLSHIAASPPGILAAAKASSAFRRAAFNASRARSVNDADAADPDARPACDDVGGGCLGGGADDVLADDVDDDVMLAFLRASASCSATPSLEGSSSHAFSSASMPLLLSAATFVRSRQEDP